MLFAYEDKRFYGITASIRWRSARAAWQFVTHRAYRLRRIDSHDAGRAVVRAAAHRSFDAKLRQIVRAFELERRLGKDEILSLYLTLAPYGGNLEGVRAASLAYFGKEPRKLSLGEAALLVALPQSPELRRPDRFPRAARARARPRARPGGRGRRSPA